MIENGKDIDLNNALYFATIGGQPKTMKLLIRSGATGAHGLLGQRDLNDAENLLLAKALAEA